MFSTPKKKPTAPPELGRAWFTLAQMHAAFGVTPQGFASSVRPLLTPEDVKNAGERGAVRIRCRAAIDAWTARKVEQAVEAARKGNDPLLVGVDSPELERYRAARADLAEMERDERNGSLIPRQQLEPAFVQYATAIRRAGEGLQRRFGNEAAAMLNEALDDAERIIRQSFGGDGK
jgi:hypothetical protein